MPYSLSRRQSKIGLILSAIACALLLWLTVISPPSFPYARMPEDSTARIVGPRKIVIGFRNDDISAYSDPALESRVLAVFRRHGIPQTFAVIPNPGALPESLAAADFQHAMILDSLLSWQSRSDVHFALHGSTHHRNPGSAGEFDGLPYDEQQRRLARGKNLLDGFLRTDIRMFAPPWNQSDDNTIEACRAVGITEFCGYRGGPPTHGVTFVNTNAVLFPDTVYAGSKYEPPSLETVFPYAQQTTGTCFLLVFYHSRTDFTQPGRFSELEKLLTLITHDSTVTILRLDDVARTYPVQLAASNIAGLNLIQVQEAKHATMLTSTPLCWIARQLHRECQMDSLAQRALEHYYRGNYQQTHLLAGKVIHLYAQQQRWGRFGLAVILTIIAFVIARRGLNPKSSIIRTLAHLFPFAGASAVVILLIVLNATHGFSYSRTLDVSTLGAMVAAALLLGGFVQIFRGSKPDRRSTGS